MTQISSTDIRVAVAALTYPLISGSATQGRSLTAHVQHAPSRLGEIFSKQPKVSLPKGSSQISYLLHKAKSICVRWIEALKERSQQPEPETPWNFPRTLSIPTLPHPPFHTPPPARFFPEARRHDVYAPPCLMSDDIEEEFPLHSLSIFPQVGRLRKDPHGFVYLELSDRFIATLFPLIEEPGILPVLSAQIPIMTAAECVSCEQWDKLKEWDEEFPFTIEGCSVLKPKRWPEMEKVYILTVKSAALEALREKYRLSPRIFSRDFHMTIGMKPMREKAKQDPEIFRLNVSCFAA